MSITDELREWARGLFNVNTRETLLAIADRIDAEYERQLEVLYRDMSDAEYVKLPKDTGGKYIHEHDKVDWLDHAGTWHENATVVAVCDDGCYVMDGTVFHVHKSNIRHHHEPTVVDVLREFAEKVIDSQIPSVHPTYEEAITEYATKLRHSLLSLDIIDGSRWYVRDTGGIEYEAGAAWFERPDSLEHIARDLEDWAEGNISGSAQSFANRIRELAKEDER